MLGTFAEGEVLVVVNTDRRRACSSPHEEPSAGSLAEIRSSISPIAPDPEPSCRA
jgi:hypothetical protein